MLQKFSRISVISNKRFDKYKEKLLKDDLSSHINLIWKLAWKFVAM